MRIVLAGGGTAGHTSPLIATAQSLLVAEPTASLVCVGTAKGLETHVIPAAGLELVLIPPVPLPRSLTPALLAVPARLAAAVSKAREVLRSPRADVVVGFGGYVALPVYLAALRLRIPIVIHEQNAVAGLANRVAARFADVVTVTFPATALPRARVVGLPLRPGIARLDRTGARRDARTALGLRPDGPVLLVSGGSQGARSINTATAEAADELLRAGVDVLHVLGPKNMTDDLVARRDPTTGAGYHPVAYVDRMEDAYAAADLMVGRSGAGTVIETAATGLPTILVPFPHGNGEQARNAAPLVAAGGAVLVRDADLTSRRLLAEVLPLVLSPTDLARMGSAGQSVFRADAADVLAGLVLATARGSR